MWNALGEEICIYCKSGYKINGKNFSICTLEHCLDCYFYEGKQRCSIFEDGFGLDEKGECSNRSLYTENCNSCLFFYNKEACLQCKSGHKFEVVKCKLVCSDENCLNCHKNNYNEVCNECKEGYKVEGAKCVKCQESNCIKCDYNEKGCTQCNNGRKVFKGKCVLSYSDCRYYINDCDYCTESGILQCELNYKLDDNGNCEKGKNIPAIILPLFIYDFLLLLW